MDWLTLISHQRLGQEHRKQQRSDGRSEYKRDYDRLIFSAPFRRLQNKTQVFPLPGSVFVHNRLTHSLEVASVGMSLGNDVARQLIRLKPHLKGTDVEEIGTIVSAACLAHDLGNPPFGHSGEKAIQAFFKEGPGSRLEAEVSPGYWDDITHFEGNANAFRLLTHRFKGRREGGFVMTYSTLAGIVKYPCSSTAAGKKAKFGFFVSEQAAYERLAGKLGIPRLSAPGEPLRYARHPLVYLVEAADDICYEIMDLEDAHKLHLVSYEKVERLLLDFFEEETQCNLRRRIKEEGIDDPNERVAYLRASVIGLLESECVRTFIKHEEEILQASFQGSLIDNILPRIRSAYEACAVLSRSQIYASKPVIDVELSGYRIINTLMEQMVDAVMFPDRYYSKQLIGRVSTQYEIDAPDLETRILAVVDYISGMTDLYALDIYQKINGSALPAI